MMSLPLAGQVAREVLPGSSCYLRLMLGSHHVMVVAASRLWRDTTGWK